MSKQKPQKGNKKIKKGLLQSQQRKNIVAQAFAISMNPLKVKRNRVGLDPKHIEIIKTFYTHENIAFSMTGKQDVITTW